jgi:hypothetical protein
MAVTRIWDADNGVWQLVGEGSGIGPAAPGYAAGDPLYFTSDGTFSKGDFPDAIAFLIECQGGGGGGGGAAVSAASAVAVGNGGGGGAYARSIVPASDLDTTEAVTVGVGGAVGTAGANPGGTGGDSVFDTISGEVRADGGSPGAGGANSTSMGMIGSYAPGGLRSASSGDLIIPGEWGQPGFSNTGFGGRGGMGGNSALGAGAWQAASNSNGLPGDLYGGGGSGGHNQGAAGTPARTGGLGAQGIVIVTPLYLNLAGGIAADLAALPRGVLAYAEVTATQSGITAETDLTGLSVTVTVPANRRIRITGRGWMGTDATGGRFIVDIKEGTAYIGEVGDVTFAASTGTSIYGATVVIPSAGSHTYLLRMRRIGGSAVGQFAPNVNQPGYILVEDIGAA